MFATIPGIGPTALGAALGSLLLLLFAMSECPELGEGLGSRGFPQEQLLLDNQDEQTM